MKRLSIIILATALLMLCSCNRDRQYNSFIDNSSLCLQIGSSVQFRYEPSNCQLGFSRSLKQFRMHTDNMSDFVISDFSTLPTSVGENVDCNITWTTATDISKKKLTLEVVKIEGENIWLWSHSGRIGLSIRILE